LPKYKKKNPGNYISPGSILSWRTDLNRRPAESFSNNFSDNPRISRITIVIHAFKVDIVMYFQIKGEKMRKLGLLFISVMILAASFSFQSYAQITVQAGAGIGYSLPTGDFGGNPVDFYNGTAYGMDPGFNFHAKARLGLVFINAFGEIGYTSFSTEGGVAGNDLTKTIKATNNVLSIKLGPEFKFSIPMSPISPYVDAFVSINSISGKVEFKGAPNGLPSSEQDINSATRVGLGAGAGVLFSLGVINFDLNIQYNAMNVFGKEFSGTKDNRLDSYTYINDDKDPFYNSTDDKHIISDSRSISALEFKLTVMFGL
jgi:opacity protein-like surface antigen